MKTQLKQNNLHQIMDNTEVLERLRRAGLENPGLSHNSRYRRAWKWLMENDIPMCVIENYDFKTLSPDNSEFSRICQVRAGNVCSEKIDFYKNLFAGGEALRQPIIGVLDCDGNFAPTFGNQRSRGLRAANKTSTVIVVAVGMPKVDKLTVAHEIAGLSNLKTGEDTDTDTSEDIGHQMINEWQLVRNSDPLDKCTILGKNRSIINTIK